MHSLGSRPHPAACTSARVIIRPMVGGTLRRDAAGAEVPSFGTVVAS
ncbi:hypothetical protein AQF52_2547 [Streptomyces venezuelae]|nr:hypothetical protein AQF52_2547 [Streptomyces venezuelae]CUM41507.1 hypothetical protein BN2537_11979 [Streptomyces venezuelae]